MCGLTGFSGKNNYNVNKIKYIMLLNAVERGRDATGIYTPNTGVLKVANNAAAGFAGSTFNKLAPDTVLIGHVRAKTIGQNLVQNAHPFTFGNVTLAHNGTLEKYSALASSYKMNIKDWDVDSQILAYGVSKNLLQESREVSILKEYEGAAALLFHDKSTNELFAWHDTERPLFYGYDEEGDMYISSIKSALDAVEIYATTEFKPNTLYTIVEGTITSETPYITKRMIEEAAEAERREQRLKNAKLSGKNRPKIKKGKKGFTVGEGEGSYFDGCWLKSKFTINGGTGHYGRMALIDKDDWYHVIGVSEKNTNMLCVVDRTDKLGYVYYSNLEIENFIPVVGECVLLMQKITSTKTGKKLWDEGDAARVVEVDYAEDEITLYNEKTRKNYIVSMDNLRAFTEIYDKVDRAPEHFIDTYSTDYPTCDCDTPVDNSQNVVEEPVVNAETEIIKDDSFDEEVTISLDMHINTIDEINEDLNQLEDHYSRGVDINPDIATMRAKMSLAVDPQYLGVIEKE